MRDGIRAVLFDAVGTLMYPDPPVARAYHSIGADFGSNLTENEIRARFAAAFDSQEKSDFIASNPRDSLQRKPTHQPRERQRWRQIVATVFRDVPAADGPLFEALWDHFAQPHHWRLYEDVTDAWNELAQRNTLELGIASNFDDRLLGICRELLPQVDEKNVFYSAEIGFSKPDANFFRYVQQRLNLPAEEILLVGDDRMNDHQGAQAAGWSSILINRNSDEPTHQIRSLDQLRVRV